MRPPRILWMDDELYRVGATLGGLRELGYEIDPVDSANEALNRLACEDDPPCDAFVWDLYLPAETSPWEPRVTSFGTRTGRLVYREFRRRWPQIPSILFTNARDDYLFSLHSEGINRAFQKGEVTAQDIASALEELGVHAAPLKGV